MRTIRQARLTSKRWAARAGAARFSLDPAPKKSCVAANTTAPPSTSWTARMMTSARIARSIVGGDRLEQMREALARGLAPRGDVLARDAVGGRLIAAQNDLRDALAVDLVGAVVEARRARVAVHRLERHVGRVSERAARTPWVSITQAACRVISRAACICAAESAIQFWIVCLSASLEPWASR